MQNAMMNLCTATAKHKYQTKDALVPRPIAIPSKTACSEMANIMKNPLKATWNDASWIFAKTSVGSSSSCPGDSFFDFPVDLNLCNNDCAISSIKYIIRKPHSNNISAKGTLQKMGANNTSIWPWNHFYIFKICTCDVLETFLFFKKLEEKF